VLCGQPPDLPRNGIINGTSGWDGSITWLYGRPDLQDTYNTWVEYRCANGSQFDTDDDGKGDKVFLRSRCQWDKTWSLASLPLCHVTHCVAPYPVPGDTALEALTAAWTLVGEEKEHRCQDPIGGVPTMFWEADRTKSTFSMTCLSDGTYEFKDIRENWPTCIQGMTYQYVKHFIILFPDILCDKFAPSIPTDPEYTLASDDGTVLINSVIYPTVTNSPTTVTKNSTEDKTLITRNYHTNLT
jgi:hypothetical protein